MAADIEIAVDVDPHQAGVSGNPTGACHPPEEGEDDQEIEKAAVGHETRIRWITAESGSMLT